MNIIENLITDLRKKRLWPVAAALVVALIAVPVILSGAGKSSPRAPAPLAGSGSAPPALPAVSVTTTPSNAKLTGPERNPFTQQVKASATGSSTPSSSSSSASTSAASSSGSAASSSGGATGANNVAQPFNSVEPGKASTSTKTSTTTTSTSSTPTATKYLYFQVNLVYGGAGAVPRTLRNVERLTPLPAASKPLIVYLGVTGDKKTAVFLVSSTVNPTGQGKCMPRRSDCQFLELRAGQADLFKDASGKDEFTLSLTAVKTLSSTSAKVAAAARARESKAGAKIISRATGHSLALHLLSYSEHTGTVTIHAISRGPLEHLIRTLGIPAALGVNLQPFSTSS